MTLFLMAAVMLLLVAVQASIPYLVKKTEVFGIYVPLQYIEEPKLLTMKKRYTFLTVTAGLTLIVLYVILLMDQNTEARLLWGTAFQFTVILISMGLYLKNHLEVKKEKQQSGWTVGKPEKIVVDLQFRNELELVPGIAFLLPVIITVGLILYTLMNYGSLPDQIPTHFGADGTADKMTDKTTFSSIALLLVLAVMQLLFFFTNRAMKTSGAKIRASQKQHSRQRELNSRKYGSWLLFITSILVTLLFGSIQLLIIHPELGTSLLIMSLSVSFVIIILVATAVFAFKMVKGESAQTADADPGVLDADQDQYWKMGIFYANKEDPSILVEKRFGVGWTINLGNFKSWLYIAVPLIVILLIVILI